MNLLVLTGASGAGKTTIVRAVGASCLGVRCFFFDSIGVPPIERMIAEFGSGAEWQRRTTIDWLARIDAAGWDGAALFEGQARIAFIAEAAIALNRIESAEIVLVDCSDEVRAERLCARAQPELANTEMMSWARYLRAEALAASLAILDTTALTVDTCVAFVAQKLGVQSPHDKSRTAVGHFCRRPWLVAISPRVVTAR